MPMGSKEEEQSRKLFIGGISRDTTDMRMREYFSAFGKIVDCVVIREPGTEKSKGFGFVTFETEGEADNCMDNRPHNLDGRTVDVKRAVSREESSKPGAHVQVKKIFVGGIKEGIDEQVLQNFFGQFGIIVSCEIPLDRTVKRPKGFGFVTFDDFDVVDKLVAKRYFNVNGYQCEVKKALSRQEMEKAKQQLDVKKQQRYSGRDYNSGGGGGGGYNNDSGFKGNYYKNGNDAGGDGYGTYGSDAYGGYGGGYNDGYGNYGGSTSNAGPMRNSYNQQARSSGPYGGGYGSGGGGGSYGGNYDSGYGGYGSGYGGYGGYGSYYNQGGSGGGRGQRPN